MSAGKAKNITWHHGAVGPEDRAAVTGQRGCVVWLTGLSGSGKSTIARALEQRLMAEKHAAYVLDGDNIRHGLNRDLGFSSEDRDENIRRIGEVAALFTDAGLIAITAFISPFRQGRGIARQAAGAGRFIEVYCEAPLTVCEQRDPKGLYKKARAGEISDFTGIDSPYEAPENPELRINTAEMDVAGCAEAVIDHLRRNGLLS